MDIDDAPYRRHGLPGYYMHTPVSRVREGIPQPKPPWTGNGFDRHDVRSRRASIHAVAWDAALGGPDV